MEHKNQKHHYKTTVFNKFLFLSILCVAFAVLPIWPKSNASEDTPLVTENIQELSAFEKIENAIENACYSQIPGLYSKMKAEQSANLLECNQKLSEVINQVIADRKGERTTYVYAVNALLELEKVDDSQISLAASEGLLEILLMQEKYAEAVTQYNNQLIGKNPSVDWAENFKKTIETCVTRWKSEEITYEEAISVLQSFRSLQEAIVAQSAKDSIEYVKMEHSGSELHLQAEACLKASDYIHAMEAISKINTSYSQYKTAKELYEGCLEVLLSELRNPDTIACYEGYIAKLDEYLGIVNDPAFSSLKSKYESRVTVLKDIQSYFDKADSFWLNEEYQNAFLTLIAGIEKYPDEAMISEALEDYRNQFIVKITLEAKSALLEKKYPEAKHIVDAALESYYCEELKSLKESVYEQSTLPNRSKAEILSVYNAIVKGFKQELCIVEEEGAGKYIYASGKKLLLGDYTDDNITVLSFSGNIIASLANIDLLFDLRDLSYDITHWGEDEYFAIYFATDVIALLPIIGIVKYIKYSDEVGDAAKATGEIADAAHDYLAQAENATDAIDDLSDTVHQVSHAADVADELAEVAQQTHIAADVVDDISDIANAGDAIADATTDLSMHYTHIKTRNEALVGTFHEVTDVCFEQKYLKYSDGRMLEGTFPVFDSYLDIQLPEHLWKAPFDEQKKYIIEQLQKMTTSASENSFLGSFLSIGNKESILNYLSDDDIADIMNGILPEWIVCHHNEQEGLVQLVDSTIHAATGHTGGMSIWGIGY